MENTYGTSNVSINEGPLNHLAMKLMEIKEKEQQSTV